MKRRYVLGMIGAALLALVGVRSDAGEVKVKASRPACSCCGDDCDCAACTCAATAKARITGKGCDYCGAAACCPLIAKVADAKIKGKACCEKDAKATKDTRAARTRVAVTR